MADSDKKTKTSPDAKKSTLGITVKKGEDMPEWYSQVVLKAKLADYSPIKGCMIIRPYGYSIWQSIQDYFNRVLKELKVENAYFPLFIPESFFMKEAEHAEGFKPEVAWIESKPAGDSEENQERLALRPTSETIMYDSYSRWIRSWRDLPLRINQWCNVVRWEVKDVKLFLRSREFLWQEGHCVYETEEQADSEARMILDEYAKLAEELLAVPVIKGRKTEKEKFAGAKTTYTIEAFMPDGKALQMGTSHNLGQGFAKAFGIQFLGADEEYHYPWQTSWGFSTRLIGSVVMVHGDDKGLVLPPRIAPVKVVIVPILFEDSRDEVLAKAQEIQDLLSEFEPVLDDRDEYSAGWKFNDWELKGVPIRIEIGPKDLAEEQAVIARRDTGKKEFVKMKDLKEIVAQQLDDIQKSLLERARKFLDESTAEAANWSDFKELISQKKMVLAPFCCEVECEDEIKSETQGVTSRCIPLEKPRELQKDEKCFHCGKPAKELVYFSRNY
ncbi:proline--tRNA ligase [Candidatus Woesearchaeota archaeon]|nr:MAG: proline--tRNA ligase [Candidatus Woesearchaeota archaeon]